MLTNNNTGTQEISFDGPNGSECEGRGCRAIGYAHTHCARCRDAIFFEDGGRETDGKQYYELPDDAMKCVGSREGCDNYIHKRCGINIDDEPGFCYECADEAVAKAQEADIIVRNLDIALTDVVDSRKLFSSDHRAVSLSDLDAIDLKLKLLQTGVALYLKDVARRIEAKSAAIVAFPGIFTGTGVQ